MKKDQKIIKPIKKITILTKSKKNMQPEIIKTKFLDLEKFINPHFTPYFISLSLNKFITLNTSFTLLVEKEYKNHHFVDFYYSRSLELLVFDFLIDNKNNPTASKISKKSGKNIMISCRSLIDYYNIDIKKSVGKYMPKLKHINQDGLSGEYYTICLKDSLPFMKRSYKNLKQLILKNE